MQASSYSVEVYIMALGRDPHYRTIILVPKNDSLTQAIVTHRRGLQARTTYLLGSR